MPAPAMITEERAGPIAKKVLLYSGGLDSVCYDHLLQPDMLLYIPTGPRYQDAETAGILRLYDNYMRKPNRLQSLPGVLNLAQFERDDLIVPNRNAHLILLASHYGDTIYLSSVEGDRSTDKDDGFYEQMQKLLDHMWSEQHWTAKREFFIYAPFKRLTKTQLVKFFLDRDGDPEALLASYSCYAGEPMHCGVCKPCFRKRVALENNGLRTRGTYWQSDFWETDWFKQLRPQILRGEYRGAEDEDFKLFMKRKGI